MPSDTNAKPVITAELSSYIDGLMERWGIPGLALAVVRSDGEVELEGYGVRDDQGSPVTPDTLFGIASCSKAFSAFATAVVMHDYETGLNTKPLPSGLKSFDWHTPVKKLLPYWELYDKYATENAQIIDLVSHQSGLPTHDLCFALGETADAVIKRLPYIRPNRGLREEWQYNNLMFMTNTKIVAALSGMPYTEFVKERVHAPLGMTHSTYYPSEAEATGKFSSSFTWVGPVKDIRRCEAHFVNDASVDAVAGGGGIISTARDMVNWLKVLLAKGVNPKTGEALVSEASVKYMTTGHFVGGFDLAHNPRYPEISTTTYGAGWFRHSYRGHEIAYHTGGTPGISAYQVLLPDDGVGLCILTNLGRRQAILMGLIHRIVEDIFGLPRVDHEARCRDEERQAEDLEKAKRTPRAHDAQPPLPLSAYCGKFKSPAYGDLTLHSASSTSAEANKVVSAFRAVDASPSAPFRADAHVPQLYAVYPRIWGSHLRFRHREGEQWDATLEAVYPKGYGTDQTPFVRVGDGPFKVEFVTEGERVMGLNMVRYSLAQNIRPGDEEKAKVWFDKVE